jgi:hypothetical protein
VVLVAFARPALADIDNDQADKLFKQAVELRDKDPAKACELFEQALGFNPQAIGTRLNVALCDERLGRIASAVEKFSEVADRAREQKLDEYLRVAEERLAALGPDVPFVTITFAGALAPNTTVVIDDRVIPQDKLAKLAIDPGDRVVVVSAPGRVAYRKSIRILKHSTTTLEIPELTASVIKSSRRTIAKIGVAAGGGLAVSGIVLGLVARSRYNSTFDAECDARNNVCSAQGASDIESARTLGNVGTAITVLGLGTAIAGGVLWYLAPSAAAERKVSVLPQLTPGTAAVVAVGHF